MSENETSSTGGEQDDLGRLPLLPWCRDCWDQAAEGTKEERNNELPETCQKCGSEEVFWI